MKKIVKYCLLLFFTATFINCYCQNEVFYYSGGKKHYLKTDSSSLMIQFKDYEECSAMVSSVKKGLNLSDEEIDYLENEGKYIMIKGSKVKNYSIDQICAMSGITRDIVDFISYGRVNKDGDKFVITNTVRCLLKAGVKISEIQSYVDKYNSYIFEQDEWGVLSIKCESEESTCNLANSLYESSFVKFSVPNMYLPIKPTSDPYYPYQFHLHNVSQPMLTHYNPIVYDLDIDAPEAWLITKGSSGIKVAVIGDGVEDHEDLNDVNGNSRVLDGFTYNCLFNCKGRPKQDDFGHEQACAGIIAASHNDLGVKGIAPNIKIVPIVIYKKKVNGNYGAPASAIARGINKSWDNLGSDVINISYSIESHDDVTEAINNAINYGRGGKGCVVVCAAGNERSSVAYPANLGNTLAVGSESPLGGIWHYSNTGPELDIVAPSGYGITSTWSIDRMGDKGDVPGNYGQFGGTSAAAPQVSGVAALILSINPNLTEEEVRCRITTTAKDLGSPGRDNTFGYGRLNANAAVSFQNLNLSDETIPGGINRFESNEIHTSDVTIAGGTITFQAKNQIHLGDNTTIMPGSTVSFEINPSFSCDFGILRSGGINNFNITEDHDNWDYTNLENNSKISIYPNPSSGYIHINTHKIKDVVKISIFNLHGISILNKEITGNVTIDISDQEKGVYYIKSVSGNYVETNKIILK
ncbi:MAG: S8 family serine peptidase [Bacteroidales bacterium]|nr:S8 family serine peptidase [Bacteroidales bacterium]